MISLSTDAGHELPFRDVRRRVHERHVGRLDEPTRPHRDGSCARSETIYKSVVGVVIYEGEGEEGRLIVEAGGGQLIAPSGHAV
jgi:hypothetical protein